MKGKTTFIATGDSFITRYGANRKNFFNDVSRIINQADVKFTNLEVTIHDYEGAPCAFSGGTWAIASPKVLEDIKQYGFNLLSCANNHALDYSQKGLLETCKNLKESNFSFAGIGENLAAASAPTYLECNGGTVALISTTTTFHPWWIAGNQRKDMKGRPGVNGLRKHVKNIVSKQELECLKSIALKTGLNAQYNLDVKEGFATETDGVFKFGEHLFAEGGFHGPETSIEKRDRYRVFQAIKEAKRQADYIIVSIHCHEMEAEDKSSPPSFMREFSKECVENGANAILGHGPHIVRGIELYKGCPIFYSLGNFIFQNDTVLKQPADFYEKYGLDDNNNPSDGYDFRSKNNSIGLCSNIKVWESIIAKWTTKNVSLKKIELIPIKLGFEESRGTRGWPRISDDTNIIKELQRLSLPFDTEISIADGKGVILIK